MYFNMQGSVCKFHKTVTKCFKTLYNRCDQFFMYNANKC